MESWMAYEHMLEHIFQQPGAYAFPFGSANMAWLYEVSDETLRRLSWGRLRDQAVSLDQVFEGFKREYLVLLRVREAQGLVPAMEDYLCRVCHTLRDLQGQQRRLRALLDVAPQPRDIGRN